MLNLVRLRKQAAYPDGRKATGEEAYAAYGRESGPVFERLGGRLVRQGKIRLVFVRSEQPGRLSRRPQGDRRGGLCGLWPRERSGIRTARRPHRLAGQIRADAD